MEYTKIKFKDLPEGVGFWLGFYADNGVHKPHLKKIVRNERCCWADGTDWEPEQCQPNDTIYIRKEDSMSLEDKKSALAQAVKDQDKSNNVFDATIADLKQQIAECEVVYSVADRFQFEDGSKFLLSRVANKKVMLIGLGDGNRNLEAVTVRDTIRITEKELRKTMVKPDKFTRYFDYQKDKAK
jgi:hypothetical protein